MRAGRKADFPAQRKRISAKRRFLRRGAVNVGKPLCRLIAPVPGIARHFLDRTNAGEHAPGGRTPGKLRSGKIKRPLHSGPGRIGRMGRRLCPRLRSAAFAFDHSFAHKLSVFLISAAGRLHAVRAKAAVREKRGRHALQVV